MAKALLLVILVTLPYVASTKLPDTVQHPSGLSLKLCSEQKITKALFFDVLFVGLYFKECSKGKDIFTSKDKLLRFHYLRDVKGNQFTEGAEEYLNYNLTEQQKALCWNEYTEINNSYLDVQEGDFYDLYHIGSIGLDLYLNQKPLNTLKSESCESLYFNVWFGKQSMDSGFRKLIKPLELKQ